MLALPPATRTEGGRKGPGTNLARASHVRVAPQEVGFLGRTQPNKSPLGAPVPSGPMMVLRSYAKTCCCTQGSPRLTW